MSENPVRNVKRLSLTFKVLAAFLFLALAWIVLAPVLANYLIVEKPLEKADAIYVLGGSAAYIERTQKAAILYKEGIAPKIFLGNDGLKGGWNRKEQRNPYFYEKARWELIAQGVPETAIEVLPDVVQGTDDEAELLAKTVKEKSLHSLLLVTSAYHTRRTLWSFDKSILKNSPDVAIGIEAADAEHQTPQPYSWWLTRTGWRTVGEEYVKIVYYWLFYW